MNNLAIHYTFNARRPQPGRLRAAWSGSNGGTVINASVEDVYRALTGKELTGAALSRAYFISTTVRRTFAIFGTKVQVVYTLYPVPGGCQVCIHIAAPERRAPRYAAQRAARSASRYALAEVLRMKEGLE